MILEATIILSRQVSWYSTPSLPPHPGAFSPSPTAAAVNSLTTPAGMKRGFFCSLLSTGTCRWNGGLPQLLAGRTLQYHTELFVQITTRECRNYFRLHFHVVCGWWYYGRKFGEQWMWLNWDTYTFILHCHHNVSFYLFLATVKEPVYSLWN